MFTGGNIKYAARAPLKALVSAAASLMLAVNASAPLRTKRCSRPASRPMTRTFSPFNSRELAMIEPVFPLAPKITYMASVTTATLSLRLFIFVSPSCRYNRLRNSTFMPSPLDVNVIARAFGAIRQKKSPALSVRSGLCRRQRTVRYR